MTSLLAEYVYGLPNNVDPAFEKMTLNAEVIKLALLLIYERWAKGAGSFWSPYLDVLPRLGAYDLLVTYTKDDMDLLRESRNAFCEWSSIFKGFLWSRIY